VFYVFPRTQLIQNFTERGDSASAMKWFEAAKGEPGIKLDEVMCVLSLAFSFKKRRSFTHVVCQNHSYNTMLKNFSGQPEMADAWVKEMVESGLKPSAYTLNKLIDIYAHAGQADKVEQRINVMADRGFAPDVFSYNSVCHEFPLVAAFHFYLNFRICRSSLFTSMTTPRSWHGSTRCRPPV
jgi:pentatricopeptide repeat protein